MDESFLIEVVLLKIQKSTENKTGLSVVGLTNSPIKGGDGNTEYLLYLKNESNPVNHISLDDIEILVKSQFED